MFRLDVSVPIGLGHLARCLALACALERRGGKAGFVCSAVAAGERGGHSPANLVEALLGRRTSFRLIELPLGIDEGEDARCTVKAASGARIDVVLVDHYGLGPEWWQAVRAEFPLAAIDDLGRPGLGDYVDLVVNQNLGAREHWYKPAPRVLCGCRFALLREDFFEYRSRRERCWVEGTVARRERMTGTQRVLVSMGGSDPNEVTPRVLRALQAIQRDFVAEITLGTSIDDREEIFRRATADSRFVLNEEPRRMSEVMASSDLAVTGGGSTVYECAYLGVPPLMIQLADNQAGICRALSAAGAGLFLGESDALEVEDLAAAIGAVLEDDERIREMSQAGMRLVDGRGARRVVKELSALGAG